jgi:hypothetical protein
MQSESPADGALANGHRSLSVFISLWVRYPDACFGFKEFWLGEGGPAMAGSPRGYQRSLPKLCGVRAPRPQNPSDRS